MIKLQVLQKEREKERVIIGGREGERERQTDRQTETERNRQLH